jgi:leucyl-tRNA synthetase
VSQRVERFEFNTAISAMMELSHSINDYIGTAGANRDQLTSSYEALLQLLHPFAPHITEEWWERLGHGGMIVVSPWPKADEALMREDVVNIAVQVNGKLRGEVQVPNGSGQEDVFTAARANAKVAAHLEGKSVVKVIYVAGKLLNVVVK